MEEFEPLRFSGARAHGEQGKRLRLPIGASAGPMPVKAAWDELEQHLAVRNLLIVGDQDFQDDFRHIGRLKPDQVRHFLRAQRTCGVSDADF
jgi:hypothetical protein